MRARCIAIFALSLLLTTTAHAQQCGTKREKIVGGSQARIVNWPGQAALRLHSEAGHVSFYFCGGTAISDRWVLTAAHCLYAFRTHRFLPPESIHFLLGYARGDFRIHARVASYALGPGYDPADETRTAARDTVKCNRLISRRVLPASIP